MSSSEPGQHAEIINDYLERMWYGFRELGSVAVVHRTDFSPGLLGHARRECNVKEKRWMLVGQHNMVDENLGICACMGFSQLRFQVFGISILGLGLGCLQALHVPTGLTSTMAYAYTCGEVSNFYVSFRLDVVSPRSFFSPTRRRVTSDRKMGLLI